MTPSRQRRITIVDPRKYEELKRRPIVLTDYISVPRLSLIDTYRMLDMLNDQSMYNLLYTYNRLQKLETQRINAANAAHKVRHA